MKRLSSSLTRESSSTSAFAEGRGNSELGTSEFLSAKIVLADPKDSKTVVITAKLVGAI